MRSSRAWFLIGGQAVRSRIPYRPTDDVDFGVGSRRDLDALLELLRAHGRVEILERSRDTVHLIFESHDVSIFVLPRLKDKVDNQALDLTGILATKVHALIDRGTRRDFFDLYVILNEERLGIIEALRALREVYSSDVNEGLVLRALSYFDDAEAEAPLPGEGRGDWETVKRFFSERVAAQLVPPDRRLSIQSARPKRDARASSTTTKARRR